MYDSRITIECVTNGYILRYRDPKVAEKNRNRGGGCCHVPWQDPEVSVAIETEEKLITALQTLLPKLRESEAKDNDYDTALADALADVSGTDTPEE